MASQNSGRTAVVRTSASSTLQGLSNGETTFSVFWGIDHPNNYKAFAEGYFDINHSEMYAVQMAVKKAAREKYSMVVIHTGSLFVYDLVQNSANFINAPYEVQPLVQSIQAYKNHIIVKVKLVEENSGDQENTTGFCFKNFDGFGCMGAPNE